MQRDLVEEWLNSKVNDKSVSKHGFDDNTQVQYYSHYAEDVYYNDNDTDLRHDDKSYKGIISTMTNQELTDDPVLGKIAKYVDHLLLYPNTNRYHANSLFRQLIDFSYDNKFEYDLYDPETGTIEGVNLMDKSQKRSFYEFCYRESK